MNTQPISKRDHRSRTGTLNVVGVFHTIQGEGPYTGQPAVFVRLAGCNLRCPACDTDYTSNAKPFAPEDLLARVSDVHKGAKLFPLVVLTGGEPFRQNCAPFINLLLEYGYRVQVETNGTIFLPGLPYYSFELTIVCSPKTGRINQALEPHVSYWKYVLNWKHVDPIDGLPSEVLGLNVRPARPEHALPAHRIYVQPETGLNFHTRLNQQAAIKTCMAHGYTYGHRVHLEVGME